MTIRVQTDCESCNAAPWPGVSTAWKPVGEESGVPGWARNLDVRRCQECGRYWHTPYDQYDQTYYTSIHPLAEQLGDLLRPGAGADALFAFLDRQGTRQADGFAVAQSYLIKASFDFGEVLRGLIVRLSMSRDKETAGWPMRLLENALSGESGRLAWLVVLRGVHGLPLPRASLDALYATLDRMDGDSRLASGDVPHLVVEVRRLLSKWRTPR